jgi:hypothetical protein
MESADRSDSETTTPSAVQPEDSRDVQASARSTEDPVDGAVLLQGVEQSCETCGGTEMSNGEQNRAADPSFVYALGQIEHRFPNLGLEKEFAQATGRADTTGYSDRQAAHKTLVERKNRYLARQLCWVLQVEGLDTYILQPRDPMDFEMLIDALSRPNSSNDDVDVVIGLRGPIASPGMCNGLTLPIVFFDQIYSFDRDTLVKAMPKPAKREAAQFEEDAREMFSRIVQMADNAGATDEHRALNYLAVRYPAIYHETSRLFTENSSLSGVDVRLSRLSGTRKILDVIFSYTHRQTDVTEKQFVRVDVTEMFPFLVTKLSPFYER